MNRPHVICHMGCTVDGRIISEHWGENRLKYSRLYEQCHNSFNSQAWMVGRVTMEKDFTKGLQPVLSATAPVIERKAFVGDGNATSFAVAVDAKGRLGWDSNEIEGDDVIEVLSSSVNDAYLQYLQGIGISYIFAGEEDIDFGLALEQLHNVFGIKKLMLEGGGGINGSVLNAGVVDEISLLLLPLADGTADTATVFDVSAHLPQKTAGELKLVTSISRLEIDMVCCQWRLIWNYMNRPWMTMSK